MKALRELCGGSPADTTRIASIQNILGKEIERYGDVVSQLLRPDADHATVSLYGCFAARKLLETGCVAVLSRLDPTRLLILREFQLRGKYEIDERHSAAIDWKNDVISEKKPSWADGVSPDKFVRALLGGHMAEVIWVTAIEAMAKTSTEQVPLDEARWIHEILDQYEGRRAAGAESREQSKADGVRTTMAAQQYSAELGILSGFRTTAQQSFSTLSKGVHTEFVVEQETIFDVLTILESMKQATKILTQIAFVSHFIDSAFSVIAPADAFRLVKLIEKDIENDA